MSRSNEVENRPRSAPKRARSSSSQPSSSRSSQARRAFSTRSRVRRPAAVSADARGPAVVGIGVADHEPVPLELLDLARHRRGVDIEHLGQRRDPDGVSMEMELVQRGGPGPVEADPGRLQKALMHAHLGDGPGHHLQAGLDLIDGDVAGGRPRGPGRRRSLRRQRICLRHVTIMPWGTPTAKRPGHNVGPRPVTLTGRAHSAASSPHRPCRPQGSKVPRQKRPGGHEPGVERRPRPSSPRLPSENREPVGPIRHRRSSGGPGRDPTTRAGAGPVPKVSYPGPMRVRTEAGAASHAQFRRRSTADGASRPPQTREGPVTGARPR